MEIWTLIVALEHTKRIINALLMIVIVREGHALNLALKSLLLIINALIRLPKLLVSKSTALWTAYLSWMRRMSC